MQVVALASDGKETVTQALLHCPDVAVIDVLMPYMNGIQAAEQIRVLCPQTRILMVSAYDFPHFVQRSLHAGASGYVLKQEVSRDLVPAIHSLHEGNRFFSRQITQAASLIEDRIH